jgi:hypothetical protein
VNTSTRAPKGRSREASHITGESTPLSVLPLFVTEIISLLVVETNRYYQEYLYLFDNRPSAQRNIMKGTVCIFDCGIIDGIYSSMQTGGLLDETGAAVLSILWANDGTLEDIVTYVGYCILQTVELKDLT